VANRTTNKENFKMSASQIKILFIIPSLGGGGAERVMVNLLRHIDRSKFKPLLAVVNLKSAVYLEELATDVELFDLNCDRVRYALPKIIRLIWRTKPQLVFSTLGHLNLWLAILQPLLPPKTHFLCRETTIVSVAIKIESDFYQKFWPWAYKTFYNRFERIICQSKYMRDDMVASFDISADKIVVINNPVDIDRLRQMAAEPVSTNLFKIDGTPTINLVSAGRMVRVKGFDLLIEALALNANSSVFLTLLGEGPLLEELKTLAQQRGIASQIRFVGYQKNPYAFFAQADAFVLSSRHEGFPNVVLEAIACGTPVIATPAVGGVREILDNMDNCLIAQSINAESLAIALATFSYGKRLSPDAAKPYEIGKIVKLYEQQFIKVSRCRL
jgi:glycosyltransferase involved in cell wall biosynthesis